MGTHKENIILYLRERNTQIYELYVIVFFTNIADY